MAKQAGFRVGDWVEVRSKAEILGTLDGEARADGMPFMPEMLQYCGRKFRVHKLAHKTCDYTTPYPFRLRRLKGTVHLQTRCDGGAHGGCQAGCLMYWKESWLKAADADRASDSGSARASAMPESTSCTEAILRERTSVVNPDGTSTYKCQATEIQDATTPLAWWDVRQYVKDYWSGNVSCGRVVSALVYSAYYHVSQSGIGVGRPMRWFYNTFHRVWRGPQWPRMPGLLPEDAKTPAASLNLQPGEWVRVKPHQEILKTVNTKNMNRGMFWDAELAPYCDGTYQVLRRVHKTIDEKTGRLLEMKTPCVILDSVVCQARYSDHRMLCPKGMYSYWREIWLERAEGPPRSDGRPS